MIRRIEDMPAGTVGLEAVGTVTADDYERVLIPALSDALERKNVRLLYLLGPQFESYSASAMWSDTKIGLRHLRSWKKVAIVSDEEWLEKAVKALGWMMPGKIKAFEVDEFDEAKAWVS
jgi:SpoIIAA-like